MWIGPEKLTQNDPSYVTICPVVPKLEIFFISADLYTVLTIAFTSKNYPNMTPQIPNAFTGSKVVLIPIFKMLLKMWLQTFIGELV